MSAPAAGADAGVRPTPLAAEHERLGATMTAFGGWWMPLGYGSDLAEHTAVRRAAGLFDLSHMGEVEVVGQEAGALLDAALVGHLSVVPVGRAKYSLLCGEDGGVVDDLIAYRLADDRYLVVPNAANTAAVVAALAERAAGSDVRVEDVSAATALVAVQGPVAQDVVLGLVPTEDADRVRSLRYYAAAPLRLAGVDALLARTGYTGEDGFEVFTGAQDAARLWRALLEVGAPHGLVPAGLAARDSLRLEAGMPLHGHELRRDVDPYASGVGPVVALGKPDGFPGRAALEAARAAHEAALADPASPSAAGRRVLVGLRGLSRRSARAGQPVVAGGEVVGEVTSGAPSPTLGHPVALARVVPACAAPGSRVEVDVRGRPEPFEVVRLPFYRRPSPASPAPPSPTPSSPTERPA